MNPCFAASGRLAWAATNRLCRSTPTGDIENDPPPIAPRRRPNRPKQPQTPPRPRLALDPTRRRRLPSTHRDHGTPHTADERSGLEQHSSTAHNPSCGFQLEVRSAGPMIPTVDHADRSHVSSLEAAGTGERRHRMKGSLPVMMSNFMRWLARSIPSAENVVCVCRASRWVDGEARRGTRIPSGT